MNVNVAPSPPCVFLINRSTKCSVFTSQDKPGQPVIFNPDFFVERLRHEHPQAFTDLVLSNITRLIDLPGDEFAQLIGESEPRVPPASGFLRSFNFLKRKGQAHNDCIYPRSQVRAVSYQSII